MLTYASPDEDILINRRTSLACRWRIFFRTSVIAPLRARPNFLERAWRIGAKPAQGPAHRIGRFQNNGRNGMEERHRCDIDGAKTGFNIYSDGDSLRTYVRTIQAQNSDQRLTRKAENSRRNSILIVAGTNPFIYRKLFRFSFTLKVYLWQFLVIHFPTQFQKTVLQKINGEPHQSSSRHLR
jgi:hypothetical protein